jgi:hypothetical protein
MLIQSVDKRIHRAERSIVLGSGDISIMDAADPLHSAGIGRNGGGVMGSRQARRYFCRCGTHLAKDNTERQCARCRSLSRDRFIAPPEVPPELWRTEQFKEAFAAQHMGRVARAYRTHPYHYAVYGPSGISQTLLGQWLGLRQPQVSRFETGLPLQHLDTLRHWARTMRVPPELLWFDLPGAQRRLMAAESTTTDLVAPGANGVTGKPEQDPVLVAPWSHRGTVEAVVGLSGGGRVKRRGFLSLTGTALTAPAHQWLVHEPEPLLSGLAGRRVSGELVGRFTAMVAELRRMDDAAGGGGVLALAEQAFGWVAGLLDQARYDDHTGRALHVVLAELGNLCGWSAYDAGQIGLAQRYYIAALRAAHSADDRPFGAHILTFMAKGGARKGHATEAVTLIETALLGTRQWATPALLAQLYSQQAYAYAVLRDASACTAAISKARTQVERLNPGDEPPWLYWMEPSLIARRSGDALLELGHAEEAVKLLEAGLAELTESFIRDRQIYVTRLADALARPGRQRDLLAAAGLGMQSLDLAESLDSARGTGLLHDLSLRLQPHDKIPPVRDFLERAKPFLDG